jgi:U4/U6 small nuclear ribonucleoprotein PRP3
MSQHRAIDLENAKSSGRSYRQRRTFTDRRSVRDSEKAIESLLLNHLKSSKIESKSESSMKLEVPDNHSVIHGITPDIEWWDSFLANDPGVVSHLVEHPTPLRGATSNIKAANTVKAYLTQEERDKLRRMKSKAKEEDLQNKIRLGLMQPPPPRIKMKNLMRVLGQEAVAGPSAVEQAARAQAEQRVQEHEQRNADRKLSPEERRQKNIAKWTKPLQFTDVIQVSAYVVFCPITGKERFKIGKNATQLHLGGLLLDSKLPNAGTDQPSLVVVEGTRRAVKRFDKLMLRRIDWARPGNADTEMKDEDESEDEDEEEDEDSSAVGKSSKCVRIFHGSESKQKLSKWTYMEMKNLQEGLEWISKKDCTHFWEMISRYRSSSLDI